jgi:hypothetical protein
MQLLDLTVPARLGIVAAAGAKSAGGFLPEPLFQA